MKTIVVGEGQHQGRTNAVLQRAVDEIAAAGGGTVVIPPGVYLMHDALHLGSRVRVVGEEGAVLKKLASIESRVPAFLGYGHYEVLVEEPDKFPVGTGVHILDDNASGFYTTVATVVGRRGDLLFVNRMFNHDYHVRHNARVVSVYSLVEACGIEEASVEGLTLDGNAEEETFLLNGCRGAALFILQSHRIAVRNVEVRAYRGDGIGFQQSTDVRVEGCHVHHNVGMGLHPGSGTVRYVMQDCRLHDNGGCGIFYCLRTTHSILRRNEIRDNAQAGISVGERDTDHLIQDNTIAGNGEEGILFRSSVHIGGDRTLVVGNRIGPNGAKERRSEIAIQEGLADVHVLDNAFSPGESAPLSVREGCRRISFAGNQVAGRAQRRSDVTGAAGRVLFKRPEPLPAVGPGALPLDGARHLNVAKLPRWAEPRT